MIFILIFTSLLLSYLIGSIPSGYWFAKYFFSIDITQSGSGNIGATNVARVLKSKKYFFLIFFLDFIKALLCLVLLNFVFNKYLPEKYLSYALISSATALLVGNAYSVFLKFKGGKGVATSVGILLFLFPAKLFLIFLALWILLIVLSKQVDIASLTSFYTITAIYYFFFLNTLLFFLFLLFLCLWLTFRHKSNIKNLLKKRR